MGTFKELVPGEQVKVGSSQNSLESLWNYNQFLATTHLKGSGQLAIHDQWLEETLARSTPYCGSLRRTNRDGQCAIWKFTSVRTTDSSKKRKERKRVGGRDRERERESFQDLHPRDSIPFDLG